MIRESVAALTIALGGDIGSTHYLRDRVWCRPDHPEQCAVVVERNALCHHDWSCVVSGMVYGGVATWTVERVERSHGRKAGRIVLGVFAAVPLGAAVSNMVKMGGTKPAGAAYGSGKGR